MRSAGLIQQVAWSQRRTTSTSGLGPMRHVGLTSGPDVVSAVEKPEPRRYRSGVAAQLRRCLGAAISVGLSPTIRNYGDVFIQAARLREFRLTLSRRQARSRRVKVHSKGLADCS